MKVTIQLTNDELQQAVYDYCLEHKAMEIPTSLSVFTVLDVTKSIRDPNNNSVGNYITVVDKRFYTFSDPADK